MGEDDPLPRTVRKFLRSLARQLRTSGELSDAARSTLASTSYLHHVLDRFVDDLPPGKLRTALLQRLQEQQNHVVSALQRELLAAAASTHEQQQKGEEQREEGKDGAPMQAGDWRRRLYDLLSGWCKDHKLLNLPKARVRLAWASCDAPVSVLWALAALELHGTVVQDAIDAQYPSVLPARALLDCLKRLVIGHTSSSHATATFLPLVPIILRMLQDYTKHLRVHDKPPTRSHVIKALETLKAIVKEVLGLIVVLIKHSRDDALAKHLHCSYMLDGFYLLLGALDMQRDGGNWEGLPNLERMKFIAPLVPERTVKSMHSSKFVQVVSMSTIAAAEFVLLHLILELFLCWEASPEHVLESLKKAAMHGSAAFKHGDDLILDILLSNLSVADFLDEKEKSLIQLVLFQALLIQDQSSYEKSNKVSKNQQKDLAAFFKRLAVARNLICTDRLAGVPNRLEDLVYRLHVPPQALEWVKAAKPLTQQPAKVGTSSPGLIGWLLKVEKQDFEAIFDYIKQGQGRDHVGAISSPDKRVKKGRTSIAAASTSDTLFFVDISGAAIDEEEAPGIGLASANDDVNNRHTHASGWGKIESKKRKRKRKRGHVLFHGHRQVMLADNQGISAVVSTESSSSSQEDEEGQLTEF